MLSSPVTNRSHPDKQHGFTLVEMLIVVPIALLVVATLISAMVAMIGDAIVANATSAATYNTQDALSRIEQDTRVAVNFSASLSLLASPQGKDGNTAPFQSSAGDLIITQQATTASPYQAVRSLIYYANQPNACGTADQTSNRVLLDRVVYFLKTNADGSKTLWRRTILNPANMSGGDANTVCNTPWQRNSCPLGSSVDPAVGSTCQGFDEKLLDNVTAFTVVYYTSSGSTTTNPAFASTIGVQLTTSQQVAGKPVTKTGVVRATRTNDAPATPAPTTPDISLLNPLVNTYNNSVLATVQWSSSFATYYTIEEQGGAGPWTSPVLTTNTSTSISTPYAGVSYKIRITAYNDYGDSAQATYSDSTPLWTQCGLTNGWVNYGGGYTPAQFTLTSGGIVKMEGLIKNGSQNAYVCTLPAGFRPPVYNYVFGGITAGGKGGYGGEGRIDVSSNGNVRAYTTGAWLSLDNIQFASTDYNYSWTNITPVNGWTNTANRPPLSFTLDNNGRVNVRGSVTAGTITDGTHIGDFPSSSYGADKYMHIGTRTQDNGNIGGFNELAVGVGTAIVAKGVTGVSDNSMYLLYYPVGMASGWISLPLQNSWTAYNATSYAPPRYRKGSDGIVTLSGLLRTPSPSVNPPVSQVIGNLPSGYRPAQTVTYYVANSGSDSRIEIQSNGNIVNLNTIPPWVSLDNLHFVADGN